MFAAAAGRADTIVAAASGPARLAALSVLRISGPQAGPVLDLICGSPRPDPRRATLRSLRDPANGEVLDQGLALFFPGPHSFTGEDVAELQIHGGAAVRAAVLRALLANGCRLAEPGEFTRRAFLNGRMDLSRAEAVGDLVAAETDAQRCQALRQLEGALAERVEGWRSDLTSALAICEACLDFSDEDDIPANVADDLAASLRRVVADLDEATRGAAHGERVRDGFVVVLAGAPNAGKSTLLNALVKRDVAIVSEIAGTTRDAIEIRCDIGGLPVTFVDTAGLRETEDRLEGMGVARSRVLIGSADLVLSLRPVSESGHEDVVEAAPDRVLRVHTKADLGHVNARPSGGEQLAISAMTGEGLPVLLSRIEEILSVKGQGDPVATRERHRLALAAAADQIRSGLVPLEADSLELVAERIRLALVELSSICGETTNEQVLDRIFASFCIGK